MKKSVRLLSLLLAVVMIFGIFAVSASAEGETVSVEIKANTDTVSAGDEITVTVNVSSNCYLSSMRWPILFSNNFFELVENSASATESLVNNGGSVICTEKADSRIYTSSCTSEKYSGILVQWTGASSAGLTPFYSPDGTDCFTFKLKVKDTAVMGDSGKILIPSDSTLFYNYILSDPEAALSPDNIVKCETLTYNFISEDVIVPAPELIAVQGSDTVIDKENGIIRGIAVNTTDDLNDYLAATLGATVKVTPSCGDRIGTGTKVELVLGDETLETYTVIIAGDVNGDALVDYTDLICMDLSEAYELTLSAAQLLAGDLNGDGLNDVNDKVALDSFMIFEGSINQVTGKYEA